MSRSPYHADAALTLYAGDALEVLRQMPAAAVQCVTTSPPYWNLRDYGEPGQLGLEPTPAEYVAKMVAVFDEVWRVLRDDGVVWLNLGDSYASDIKGRKVSHGVKTKDLVGIPWRVALGLQDAGWYLRSDIIWSKPNPMPESVRDRPTKAHEYIFLLTKNARYFYDADAVRTPAKSETLKMPDGWDTAPGAHGSFHRNGREKGRKTDKQRGHGRRHNGFNDRWDAMPKPEQQAMGANLRSVWQVATHPYPDAHFATFPPKLIEPCILAGTSDHGACPDCGAPWQRVVEREVSGSRHVSPKDDNPDRNDGPDESTSRLHSQYFDYRVTGESWQPTCDCDAGDPVPCVVMDPFLGSGTTALVAQRLGRHCVGIDISTDYLDMAIRRCAQKTLWFNT